MRWEACWHSSVWLLAGLLACSGEDDDGREDDAGEDGDDGDGGEDDDGGGDDEGEEEGEDDGEGGVVGGTLFREERCSAVGMLKE